MSLLRLVIGLALGLAVAAVAAPTGAFESSDFNVTEALLDQGIDISEIPALADFNETAAVERRSTGSSCSIAVSCRIACSSLKFIYGSKAVYSRGESTYENFTDSYWSDNQAQVDPFCVFKPSKGADVSVAILVARLTQCPFAAKSGGHAAMAGASSIEGGITISFANMKDVTLSKDKSVASIGPGNIWGEVFATLTKSDLSVVGGRLYNIGVGGLTTGGGISYFSNLYGWACDNVDSYDVVTASGVIVRASATQYPDLFWALRGGGNNFGLVVSFNLKTISLPGGKLWGGSRMYFEDSFLAVENAFVNIIANSAQDPQAGLYVVYVYSGGAKLVLPALYHKDPNGGASSIWADFDAIPAITDSTKTRVLAEWGAETMNDSPPGLREVYYVLTIKADSEILTYAREYFFETVTTVADIPGIVPNIVVQGITVPQMQQMQKSGGNALGLDPNDGPLYIIQLCGMWTNASDDDKVYAWMSDILNKVKAAAKAKGVDNDYVYMNYASQFQDVVSSYGATNKAKLKSISNKYDPAQVFQKLQPGYFKLDHAPISGSGYFNI